MSLRIKWDERKMEGKDGIRKEGKDKQKLKITNCSAYGKEGDRRTRKMQSHR